MTPSVRALALGAAATTAAALLAGCGSSSDAASGGSPGLTITAPSDGATVGRSVEVAWTSSVQLGAPDTGRDHVHVFVDGHSNDYTVVGGNSFTVKGLSPGEHVIDVTLQHADHSSAGADDHVDVTVTGGAGGAPAPSPDSGTPGPSYDY